jgi:hypothetical protein
MAKAKPEGDKKHGDELESLIERTGGSSTGERDERDENEDDDEREDDDVERDDDDEIDSDDDD